MVSYISLLPFELWHQIFAQIPDNRLTGSGTSDDPLSFLRDEEFACQRIRQAQANRVRRLTICQYLRPIAEEYAYSEVYIFKESQVGVFASVAATARLDGGGLRGNLTRGLSLADIEFTKMDPLLELLKTACPNLENINLILYGRAIPFSIEGFLNHWSGSLRTFSWLDKETDLGVMISSLPKFGGLTSLSLRSPSCWGSAHLVIFPSVKKLSIASLFKYEPGLSFPNLQWLRLEMSEKAEFSVVSNFIHRHETTLTCIELFTAVSTSLGDITYPLFNSPTLETLIICAAFKRLDPSIIGDTSVKTLIYRVGNTLKRPDIRHFLKSTAIKLNSTLERFVLVVDPGSEKMGEKKLRDFRRLFRKEVVLEVRPDPIFVLPKI